MVQPKRFLSSVGQDEGERPKRQNSGDLRRRSRKLSSEEEEYTTDETSDEEEEGDPTQSSSSSGRKSSKPPRRWQASEDKRLAESVKLHGEANWKAIASKVGSRNHVQCLQRWKKVLRPGLVKGQWSSKEDSVLMKLATSGYKNWGVLSNHMPGRTSKQCRERWCHHLNPTINKGAYSPEEDKIIVETQARLGNKWSQIAARLPGRTENSIKIRCKALQRKGTSGGGGGSGGICGGGSGRGGGGGGGRAANAFGATRKSSVSSSPRSRASSASSAGSAQSSASAADSVADEPMPEACRDDVALPEELCSMAATFPSSRRRAASVPVKCEVPALSSSMSLPLSLSSSPPPPSTGVSGPGDRATMFSAPHSPFLQRRPGKGKALQLSASSYGGDGAGAGGGPAQIVRTPPPAPAPVPPPSPMPAAVDAGNHGRWRLWPKASAAATTTTNNATMKHSISAPLWSTPVVVAPTAAGSMKEDFSHQQRLAAGGSFLDYVPPERSSSVSGTGGIGGGGGFEGAAYAPMSGSSRSMSVCGALTQQSQSLQQQQQQQVRHQQLQQLQQQQQQQQQLQQQQQQLQQQQQQTEPLSHFFEYGLNAVMGQASPGAAGASAVAAQAVTPEHGQACALPPRGFAAAGGPAGLSLFGGLLPQQLMGRSAASEHAASAAAATAVATTGDKEEGGEAVFGDFNALGVDDLKAAVGGEDDDEDDAAAPLRSCCSFLDLPAEGMVVGDMPLSW